MMAAGTALSYGASVTVYEHTGRLGKKLAITGKGRCNVTNDCDINTFLESYDLTGKTIILLATSGGSSFGKTAEKLADSCKGAVIKGEKLLNGKVDEDMLSGWIKELGV